MSDIELANQRLAGLQEKISLLEDAVADTKSGQPIVRRRGALNTASWSYSFIAGLERLKALDRASYETKMQPLVDTFLADAVISWWLDIRGEVIHDTPPRFKNRTQINQFGPKEMQELQTHAPQGTKSIFFGDGLGGNGYEVETADGETTKVYFNLDPAIGSSSVNFPEAPNNRELPDLGKELLDKSRSLLEKAASWVSSHTT